MVSSPADIDGAALIAPAYSITIKILDDASLLTHIRAVGATQGSVAARQHRSTGTAVTDFMHEHFTWNRDPDPGLELRPRLKSEYEAINEAEWETVARDIRNLAEQNGERVPDKREARAMARLLMPAKSAVLSARMWESFKARREKQFLVTTSATTKGYSALLFVGGSEKVVAKGVGANHHEAMWTLQEEVGIKENERDGQI